MVYKWKDNYRANVKAEVFGGVCEELEKSGNLTPAALVNVSREETAPLHKCFEWRDEIAAEKYREAQAGSMLRHLEIVTTAKDDDTPAAIVRAHFPVEGEGYRNISYIMSDDEKRENLLRTAKGELARFRHKYKMLKELAPVFAAIEELERGAE